MMFAKVGIIQQSAKHNLKKNFEARQYRLEIHVGIGISATKRKNEGVSLALRKHAQKESLMCLWGQSAVLGAAPGIKQRKDKL